MILFTILLITLVVLAILAVLCVAVLGAAGIVVFGDVIVSPLMREIGSSMVERRIFRRLRVRIPFYFFYYLFSFTRKEKSYERKNDTQKKLAENPDNTRCDGDGIYSIRNGESHTKSTVTYSGGGGSKRRRFDCT